MISEASILYFILAMSVLNFENKDVIPSKKRFYLQKKYQTQK